jgi:glycosyltransferase involved in cell wall biosynthesis
VSNELPAPVPLVSVILPVRNERGYIGRCLEGVLGQDYPSDRMEVLIADGRSTDGTRPFLAALAARDARVRVIDNPRGFVSPGLNAAIAEARGDVIVRMDAHTDYAPDYVQTCVEVLEATGADNVGGPARTRADTYWQRAIAAAYHSPFSCGGSRFHNVAYEGLVDTVTYGCWPRAVFDRVGLFDEELVRNQDDEHNLRLTRAGGRVWQSPRIRSWYRPRGSLAALFRQYMQYGYWKVRVIRKHRLPASVRHLVPGLFVLTVAVLVLLAPFVGWGLWALAAVVALYVLALLWASVSTARSAGWALLPALPPVFACYHVGYGYGFCRGVFDSLWRRKKAPAGAFSSLTRPVARSGGQAAPEVAAAAPVGTQGQPTAGVSREDRC